ncbi:ATP-binding cassette domain-containing protein [Streptomyces sp. SCUT-3]|uniref:ABC-F family ATP-binding cassette domain-containing protein n=1 Tax=Streptomyces sp. SCUT-3 TaxID=2684469 RepID=UPI0015F87906|nr:ABC-F family ATP-binding cassette domain-containing protein [Streptomyces sp. SCUT-3]QMV22817.1 ATP-binding cassette domain-containing protein [Streptomyces sp. SCUT-3]
MPTQITALDVTKAYDGRPVLEGVTCSLAVGGRTGVIGENGSGKTTLLRLLAGRERPDHGQVVLTAEGGTGYLAQDAHLPPHATVQEVLDDALADLRAIEARMRLLESAMADGPGGADRAGRADVAGRTDGPGGSGGGEAVLSEYGDLLTLFELRGGYDADARTERALHGLGLAGLRRDRAAGTLSGGEQARLRLAAVLVAAPEVLLLDEPTNHLDDTALTWLEDHLRSRRGTTAVVSHDRVFLERVATDLLEVDADRRRVVRYGNGYAGYLAERAAARRRRVQEYERWRDDVDAVREAAATTARRVAPGREMKDRNKMAYGRAAGRVQQSLASRVRNAEERLRRLLADPVPPPPEPLRFAPPLRAGSAARAGGGDGADGAVRAGGGVRGALLDAGGVAVAGRLAPVSLTVAAGERLLVTGPNGAGKSTLLHVLAGELAPDAGTVARRGRIAHLRQETAPGRPGQTLLEAFAHGRPGPPQEHAERLLSLGLFDRGRLDVPVRALSTGQRQRLALARLVDEPADVLLLDEPTNHLSLALAEELEEALEHYDGALVLVSHDRRTLQRWKGSRLDLRAPAGSPAESPAGGR